MVADNQKVDVLLLGELQHLEHVAGEECGEPYDVVVQVQVLDAVVQGQLVLAGCRALLARELPHDELLHAHAERDVQ